MRVLERILAVVGGLALLSIVLGLVTMNVQGPYHLPDNQSGIAAVPANHRDSAVPTFKGCRLKSTIAPVCTTGRAAAMAYQLYRFDSERMRLSHSQQVLQDAGCYLISADGPPIEELSKGKVAFSDGWANVIMVSVGPGGGEIAEGYLEGQCQRYKPVITTYQPEHSLPDFGSSNNEPADNGQESRQSDDPEASNDRDAGN